MTIYTTVVLSSSQSIPSASSALAQGQSCIYGTLCYTNVPTTTISGSSGSSPSVSVVPERASTTPSCVVMTYTAYTTTTMVTTATVYESANSVSSGPTSGASAIGSSSGSESSAGSTKCDATAQAPAPTQPGVVSGCTKWYVAVPGDDCYQVAQKFGVLLNTFMDWNPGVEPPTCLRMLAGDAYCVATCGTNPSAPGSSFGTGSGTPTAWPKGAPGTSSPTSTTSTTVWWTPSASPTLGPLDNYKVYQGDGSVADGWPSIEQWVSWDYMYVATS